VFGCDYDREAVVTLLPDALSLAAWTFIDTWDLGYGMLISGNVGVGKTYMASAVCNEVLKLNCRSMTFATVTMMLREFRAFEQSDGSGSLLNDLQDPDLLVLDDIGAEKRTEWTECALYETVAYRVAKKKPIIVTTNCSLPDLEKKIGQRTLDRFVGSLPRGGITIAGKSRRTGVDWSNPDGRDAKK
jgi:DNA replication protein DnaC